MKEILFAIVLVLALFLLLAWLMPSPPNTQTKTEGEYKYRTTTIEGCEYFVNHTYLGHSVLTHKGNCTNHLHSVEAK